jgi:inner membrane protein
MAQFAPTITLKIFGIALLALVMLIPLAQVQGLIGERSGLRDEAVARIAERWGAAQTIGGPVVALTAPAALVSGQGWVVPSDSIALPDRLDMTASLVPELRRYGIYDTPVYTATMHLRARFEVDDLAGLRPTGAGAVAPDRVELRLPLTDVRGLREVSRIRVNGSDAKPTPGATLAGMKSIAIALPIDALDAAIDVEMDLVVAGTEQILFLPLARTTVLKLDAAWGDPSFIGAFLPASRVVETERFGAQWQVLELNRGYGQRWSETDIVASNALAQSAFGVTLYQPAGVYQRNERAGKYGVLFIALSFVAFFLFEVLGRLRVHPVQYLLVGLALTTFYLVLLALSEQIGFSLAYAAAAGAVVLMVGGYAAAVLSTRRGGVMLGACLAVVYALLYGLVVSEQYSLLIGAVALLAVVALLMFLTRRVDWYGYARPVAT